MFTAKTIEALPIYLDTLVAEWADGDIAGLRLLLINSDLRGNEASFDVLIIQRNRKWESQIEDLLEPEGSILVVEIAHLAGKDSVIELLEQRNIRIDWMHYQEATNTRRLKCRFLQDI